MVNVAPKQQVPRLAIRFEGESDFSLGMTGLGALGR